MMLMSQCNTFEAWSLTVMSSYVQRGYMKLTCDLIETQDLLAFQTFTNLIQTYGPQEYMLPNITGTGVPLSTIFVAHHNLVTYGVSFEWTRPRPPPGSGKLATKRYYSPETAVEQLASGDLFRGDAEVQAWYRQNRGSLEPASVVDVPGMAKWVQFAQVCFATEVSPASCSAAWPDVFNLTHPFSDDISVADGL